MISIIHPSRGRPEKSYKAISKLFNSMEFDVENYELIVSVDMDDPKLKDYRNLYASNSPLNQLVINNNRSVVDAINFAARESVGNIIFVVSDDTDCEHGWNTKLHKELEGKEDFLLKTDDGIQDYIVTQTIMDRKYFKRDNYIYHPDFSHQFADTYLTCLADIRGRLIFSNLEFPHRHYSYSGGKEMPDALHRRNDATWMTGQDTFVRLMKEFSPEERARIKNPGMRGFMKRVGL